MVMGKPNKEKLEEKLKGGGGWAKIRAGVHASSQLRALGQMSSLRDDDNNKPDSLHVKDPLHRGQQSRDIHKVSRNFSLVKNQIDASNITVVAR